ncbi:phosphatidylethanolamine-binding protein 4 isoform 2-T2 [Clarias gariepinus]
MLFSLTAAVKTVSRNFEMFSLFRALLLVVVACLQRTCQQQPSEPSIGELLTNDDQRRFCSGGLELSYPDLDVHSCLIIPKKFRKKITQEWRPPQVWLATADEKKKYTLMMVDPDAPSRTKPISAHWRHWLLADIKGQSLRTGDVKGTLLSEYARPTPPKRSGFHRYQFLVYEQNTGQVLSLSKQEKSSLASVPAHAWQPGVLLDNKSGSVPH